MMVLGAIYLFWALFDAWALIDALIFLPLGYLAYAKYSKSAKTDHIMPANVPKKKYNEVLKDVLCLSFLIQGSYKEMFKSAPYSP